MSNDSRKRPFQAGDRVSVYGYVSGVHCNGYYATVTALSEKDWLWVKWEDAEAEPTTTRVHSKQCRRLVKRPKGERFYAAKDPNEKHGPWSTIHSSLKEAEEMLLPEEEIWEVHVVRKVKGASK